MFCSSYSLVGYHLKLRKKDFFRYINEITNISILIKFDQKANIENRVERFKEPELVNQVVKYLFY